MKTPIDRNSLKIRINDHMLPKGLPATETPNAALTAFRAAQAIYEEFEQVRAAHGSNRNLSVEGAQAATREWAKSKLANLELSLRSLRGRADLYEQARQRRAVEWLGPEPTEPADIALLTEIRSWVRSLPEKERAMKMLSVASSGDKMALRAVLNAPSYLTGLDAEMMERIRDEMFRRADPVQHEKDIAIVKALNIAERAVDGVLRFIDHEVGGIEEKEAA